ncbi:GNAT family N-acetyltransferase [Rhodoligotrophos ferricapiens]|uniref:GNAT family N-acetyltransferase n=1 Tax=Rhodoligotrophos ferricapiens TaxID=3069264 RepID=UPI00315D176A
MDMAVRLAAPAPFIETGRLILTAPASADAGRIAALCNDRTVAENTALIPHPYAIDDALSWLASLESKSIADALVLAIRLNIPDPVLIGVVGIERKHTNGEPELGYWLGAGYRGRGFATEAAKAAIRYAFQTCGHPAIAASCRLTNIASRRVIEKCGFSYAGLIRTHMHALGKEEPMDFFRLSRDYWLRRQSGSSHA